MKEESNLFELLTAELLLAQISSKWVDTPFTPKREHHFYRHGSSLNLKIEKPKFENEVSRQFFVFPVKSGFVYLLPSCS